MQGTRPGDLVKLAGCVSRMRPPDNTVNPFVDRDARRRTVWSTLTRLWAERGSRPPAPRDCRYEWAYIFGAVCPTRGVGAALVLPNAKTEAMNLHLAELSRCVLPGCHGLVTIDGAGWHQLGPRLKVPENISLLHLPPYSPELNPPENIWQYLRQNYLANRVFETYEAIVDACCNAWNSLAVQPESITSLASRAWAEQVTSVMPRASDILCYTSDMLPKFPATT